MARSTPFLLITFLLLAGLGSPNASGAPPGDGFTKELKAQASRGSVRGRRSGSGAEPFKGLLEKVFEILGVDAVSRVGRVCERMGGYP